MNLKKTNHEKQPWRPSDATNIINELALDAELTLLITDHATDRMFERSLIMSDLLHVLKRGYVFKEPEPATRDKFFKYSIEQKTPNSDSRTVKVIVIPNCLETKCKIVSVMWKDEK